MPFKDIEQYRAYQREYKRCWYRENKAKHISYVRKREVGIETWFRRYKETLSCEICGENHPACLDFHHLDPSLKKFSVSAKRDRPVLKQLQEEIANVRFSAPTVIEKNITGKEKRSVKNAPKIYPKFGGWRWA